jgi:hypothetical protein
MFHRCAPFQSLNRCASFNGLGGGSKARPELAERVQGLSRNTTKEVMARISDLTTSRNALTEIET